MKVSTLILLGSFGVNAALAVLLVTRPTGTSSATGATMGPALTESRPANLPPPAPAAEAPGEEKPTTWLRVQADDVKALAARLTAAGFPPSVVRAMIAEKVHEQFAARRKAIVGEAGVFEYWKPTSMYTSAYSTDPNVRSALRDLSREESAMMKGLLGPDPTADNELADAYRRQRFGNLTKEKADQVSQIAQDYADLSTQVRSAAGGVQLEEDRTKLAYLEAEKRKDLAQLLTPAELEDYLLHSSPTTSRLRSQLGNLDLTEDQFRTIYNLQQPYDEKYSTIGMSIITADTMKARTEAQKQVTAEVKAALGEPLGTEYEHAQDSSYQTASRLVARLGLPKETTQQVVNVQKDVEQRATALRSDRALPADQRNAQLAALAQEATDRLTTSLGARGLTAYKENGGYWLSNLVPPPPPPRTTPNP